ncbi:MAG: hypothetical protein IPG49_14975 [Proteobacteria bacterium]|jgi:hypothetical protein|nr:hypothetical protein [Pseudomonadota bacterium]
MSTQRLVVRSYAPLRRAFLIGAGVVMVILAMYAAFEWGRGNAGFDSRSARAEGGEMRDRIRALEVENKRQRLELAAGETQRVGQAREREELARTIGDLQADVARLTRDLAFYRGVMGESNNGQVVRVQQLRITRGKAAGEFMLRLVLGRPLRPEDFASGKARVSIEGSMGATATTLDLAQVSDVPGGELTFSYRYVQTLDQPVMLPEGFVPARVTVELNSSRKGANPVRETFLWTVENG